MHQVHDLPQVGAVLLVARISGLANNILTLERLVVQGAEELTPRALIAASLVPTLYEILLGERQVREENHEGPVVCRCAGSRRTTFQGFQDLLEGIWRHKA